MARVLKMSRDSIVASKGSAVILSLITILCCGIIFVALVWVPFFIKSSKSYLQVFVDELCLRLYQELPFTAAFGNLNLDLRDDRSAFSVALNRVRTLINFGNGPVAFVGIVPSQQGRGEPDFDGTLDVRDLAFFQVILSEDPQNNQWTLELNRFDPPTDPSFPSIPQFADHLQALHPTRSENSVVICFSQGTIERAAWMLPLMRQQAPTVSAISGLFQNISNINSPPTLSFVDLANQFGVNTYPSPLVLFEWDNQQENLPVCSGEGGTVTCADDSSPQQFNVRRVAKKLTAIHLINLLARNGATRHSTRVGIVWEGQDPNDPNNSTVVEGVLFKAVGRDLFGISLDPPPRLNFTQQLCRYYSSRKTSLEDLFWNSGLFGFGTLNCEPFIQVNRLDVLDVVYFSDQIPLDDPNQYPRFNVADQLPLSPHIIWIGTDPRTFEIFLRQVFIRAIPPANNDVRPVVTAILFPREDVNIIELAAILANFNLIEWDTRNNQVLGLTFRSPFFNIFVFDGCGYIDVPNIVSDDPPSPYWECLTDNTSRLDGNDFQDFLRAFAEGNVRLSLPQGIPWAPFVQRGRVPGNTIAERLAVYIYRTFLTSRGWLF